MILICPHCDEQFIIKTRWGSGKYFGSHFTFHPQCELSMFLYATDKIWKLDDEEEYVKRFNLFVASNEYKTVIKQEILKQL